MILQEIKGLPCQRNFNPSIVQHEGVTYLAFRGEDDGISSIYIGKLSEAGEGIEIEKVTFPAPGPRTNLYEDPRLFVHEGKLWLSFIAAHCAFGPHYAAQGVCWLDGNKPMDILYPNVGNNHNDVSVGNMKRLREKNWTFFSHGEVRTLYTINPFQLGRMDEVTGEVEFKQRTRFNDQLWKFGIIHGSAGLIPWNLGWLGVFHSFHMIEGKRNYFVGFYRVDAELERVTHISSTPVLEAVPDEERDLRPKDQDYRPNAIFPCGLAWIGEKIAMSYGWQDCRAMLATFRPQDIGKYLSPIPQTFYEVDAIADKNHVPKNGFRAEWNGKDIRGRTWRKFKMSAAVAGLDDEATLEELAIPHMRETFVTKKWRKK